MNCFVECGFSPFRLSCTCSLLGTFLWERLRRNCNSFQSLPSPFRYSVAAAAGLCGDTGDWGLVGDILTGTAPDELPIATSFDDEEDAGGRPLFDSRISMGTSFSFLAVVLGRDDTEADVEPPLLGAPPAAAVRFVAVPRGDRTLSFPPVAADRSATVPPFAIRSRTSAICFLSLAVSLVTASG